MKILSVVAFLGLFLSGCAMGGLSRDLDTSPKPPSEPATESVGGIVGGGLVARAGVPEMSRRQHVTAIGAEYRALETAPANQTVEWNDERTKHYGKVTAAQPYRVGSQDCRPYSHTVEAGGREYSARGTACRNEDGSWTVLD